MERAVKCIKRAGIDIEIEHFINSSCKQKRLIIKQMILIIRKDGKKRKKSGRQQNISIYIPIVGSIQQLFRFSH